MVLPSRVRASRRFASGGHALIASAKICGDARVPSTRAQALRAVDLL